MQIQDYGIDWEGPISTDDDTHTVILPDLALQLNSEQSSLLSAELVCHHDEKFGVEQYVLARAFISEMYM